jgi:hypothetical protein
MFDLEQYIAQWRQEMLTAGIQAPVPLEELESHLRDEIDRLVASGKNESSAFALAVEEVGRPQALKTEFSRARDFVDWLGPDTDARVIRVLSVFWLMFYAWGFCIFGPQCFMRASRADLGFGINLTVLLIEIICLRGLMAGVRLLRGNACDKRLLWLLAILNSVFSLEFFTDLPKFGHFLFSWEFLAYILISFSSVWFLRPTRRIGLVAK